MQMLNAETNTALIEMWRLDFLTFLVVSEFLNIDSMTICLFILCAHILCVFFSILGLFAELLEY